MGGLGGNGGQGAGPSNVFIMAASGGVGVSDLSGQFVSVGHNLIGQNTGSGLTNGLNDDLAGSVNVPLDPMLGNLTNNGGFAPTLNLLPMSPAIDAGDDSVLNLPDNLLDERGEPRLSGAHVDIGAVEYNGFNNGVLQSPVLKSGEQSDGNFGFFFNGAPGITFNVLASTNLSDWTVLNQATEISRGWFQFEDLSATNYPMRFYRITAISQ
jgi:hypothetical protein